MGVSADEDALMLPAGALTLQVIDYTAGRRMQTSAQPPLEESGIMGQCK